MLVCVAAMLLSCMGMTAFADNDDYVTYTMQKGDYVGGVCEKLKIDFDRNAAWIKDVNGIKNWAQVPVGKVIVLPKFDTLNDPTRAANVKASLVASNVVPATVNPSASPSGSTVTPTAEITDADILTVTVQAGDSVIAICTKNKLNFYDNQNWIKEANGIANWNDIKVGKVLYLPKFNTKADPTKANNLMAAVRAKQGLTPVTPSGGGSVTPSGGGGSSVVPAIDINDADILTVTVKAGDTVSALCDKNKIDFATNQNWIKDANVIANWNNIKVGKVLYLPKFDTTKDPTKAQGLMATCRAKNGASAVVPTGGGGGGTTPVPSGGNTTAGDTITGYLVYHKLKAGETAYSVCNALGVNFEENSEAIKTMSGITNWNKLSVGTTLVIPSKIAPTGDTYVSIVCHTVVAGETVGSICAAHGIDYGSNIDRLKGLNNTNNLGVIRAGQKFYLPIAGGGSVTPSGGGTTPSTNPAHGTFVLQVNGAAATNVSAGQTVTIKATPETGYKVEKVNVIKATTLDAITVTKVSDTEYTFTMPDVQITVSVTFTKA